MALSAFVRLSREKIGNKGKGPYRRKALKDAVATGKGLPKHDAPPAVLWEWVVATLDNAGCLMSPTGARKWIKDHDWEKETAQAMPSLGSIRAMLQPKPEAKPTEPEAKTGTIKTPAKGKTPKPKTTRKPTRKAHKPS